MKILALEFSSEERSVAVIETQAAAGDVPSSPGSQAANPTPLGVAVERGVRGAPALALVERALAQSGIEREAIDCLAVGLGPGSYTGIRAAIALAQGWQLARNTKILSASSVECLAAQAQTHGYTGNLQVVIDAQRQEFYLAGYAVNSRGYTLTEPLRLASREDVIEKARRGDRLIGPAAGADLPSATVVFPAALALAGLAARLGMFVAGHQLEPIYLRPISFVKAPPPRCIPD